MTVSIDHILYVFNLYNMTFYSEIYVNRLYGIYWQIVRYHESISMSWGQYTCKYRISISETAIVNGPMLSGTVLSTCSIVFSFSFDKENLGEKKMYERVIITESKPDNLVL